TLLNLISDEHVGLVYDWLKNTPSLLNVLQKAARKKKQALAMDNVQRLVLDWLGRKSIPIDVLQGIMVAHREYVGTEIERKNATLTEHIRKARQSILNAIKEGRLFADHDITLKRFEEAQVQFIDDLITEKENIGGRFDVWSASIELSPSLNEQQLQEVLVHEYLHALSGRAVVHESWSFIEDETDPESEEILENNWEQVVGLSKKHRFHWLNEAMTEKLT